MNIETKGLGAGSYPEPPEENTKTVQIRITMVVSNEIEVPVDWDNEHIRDDIQENLNEYFDNGNMEEYEIEVG